MFSNDFKIFDACLIPTQYVTCHRIYVPMVPGVRKVLCVVLDQGGVPYSTSCCRYVDASLGTNIVETEMNRG